MPITRKHFELGITRDVEAWMKRIYAFLQENKDAAYTREELADALGVDRKLAAAWQPGLKGEKAREALSLLEHALTKLVELEGVESREVRDNTYYAKGRRSLESILSEQESPF